MYNTAIPDARLGAVAGERCHLRPKGTKAQKEAGIFNSQSFLGGVLNDSILPILRKDGTLARP